MGLRARTPFRPTRAGPSSTPLSRDRPRRAGRKGRRAMETAPQTTPTTDIRPGRALAIERYFTTAGVAPFDTVEWELRTAAVGSFRPDDAEVPKTWPQHSTN